MRKLLRSTARAKMLQAGYHKMNRRVYKDSNGKAKSAFALRWKRYC